MPLVEHRRFGWVRVVVGEWSGYHCRKHLGGLRQGRGPRQPPVPPPSLKRGGEKKKRGGNWTPDRTCQLVGGRSRRRPGFGLQTWPSFPVHLSGPDRCPATASRQQVSLWAGAFSRAALMERDHLTGESILPPELAPEPC